jgi:hypothetical protein
VLPLRAQPDALGECVEHLAKRAAALPHERKMTLVWTSHAALSDERVESLRALFTAQMEAAQVRFVRGEAAPALSVSIEQTPSEIVFTARVPGDNNVGVAIEQLPRALAGTLETPGGVRLEKELLWREETRVLSAVLLPAGEGGEQRLALLGEETLTIYQGQPGNWKMLSAKPLPGPRQPPRAARGQLLPAGESSERLGILLPGRRCETSLTDASPVACAGVAAEWPAGIPMALPGCGAQTWWLGSEGRDFVSEDRLLLREAASGRDTPVAELAVDGPVVSISPGPNAQSATVVLLHLGTGNYEVYRVAAACGD